MRDIFRSIYFLIYCAIIVLLLILPRLQYSISIVRIVVISIPFVLSVIAFKRKVLPDFVRILICLFFIAVLRFVWNTMGDVKVALNTSILLYICVLPVVMYTAMTDLTGKRERVLLCLIIVSLLAYIGIKTYVEFSRYPTVARMLARGTREDELLNSLRWNNIGGFGFSYCLGFFCPYLALLSQRYKGAARAFVIALLVCVFIFIVKTQYTTLVLLSFFFIIYVYVVRQLKVVGSIAFATICFILLLFMGYLFLWLSNVVQLQMLSDHFYDMSTGEWETRLERVPYAFSLLRMFSESPLLGARLDDAEAAFLVAHSHSTFLGLLGGSGLLGTLLFYGALFIALNVIKSACPKYNEIKSVYGMYFVLSVLNPIACSEISVVVFLLIPLLENIQEDSMVKYMERKQNAGV